MKMKQVSKHATKEEKQQIAREQMAAMNRYFEILKKAAEAAGTDCITIDVTPTKG